MYPETPVLSFISATLSLAPLIWYLQARNIAALAVGVWLFLTNLTYAVDALVWAGNADIKASAWCDISTSLITGSRIGLPAACLCICIHLERLASFCLSPQAKQRRVIFECLMCFGLPLAYIALHLVVQPRRFDLFYGFGCRPASYPTIATIFLVMIPPLLLTVATIIFAGIARRHFVVHGVRFYGKRGSISSPTRNLYLRLVGMAVLEAVLSAVLIAVIMRGVLSPGLAPIADMPRDLGEVLVWSSEALTGTAGTILQVEWSLTAVQSIVFFGLFACRTEVVRGVWEFVCPFLQLLRGKKPSVGASERSSTSSITVPTLPLTEVDLSLVIHSASTLTPYGESTCKFPSVRHLSRPPSCAGDASAVMTSATPSVAPLKSPSRASATMAPQSSLVSNFDPHLSPDAWPRTPTAVPVHFLRLSRGSDARQLGESWSDAEVPFPRARLASHIRSSAGGAFGEERWYGPEKRHAVYVRETR